MMTEPQTRRQAPLDYSIHYKFYHDDSEEHAREQVERFKQLYGPYLPRAADDTPALDIGCGTGFALMGLRELGFTNVRGIDTDAAQVKTCRARGLTADLVEDSIAWLGSRPEKFGVVLLLDLLEHVPHEFQVPLLRAISDRMAPGGRVLITVPNANFMFANRWLYQDHTHHRSYTEVSVRFILLNSGFENVQVPPGMQTHPRPSIWELFSKEGRWRWKVWFFRWFYYHAFDAEFRGRATGEITGITFDANLTVIAYKPS